MAFFKRSHKQAQEDMPRYVTRTKTAYTDYYSLAELRVPQNLAASAVQHWRDGQMPNQRAAEHDMYLSSMQMDIIPYEWAVAGNWWGGSAPNQRGQGNRAVQPSAMMTIVVAQINSAPDNQMGMP